VKVMQLPPKLAVVADAAPMPTPRFLPSGRILPTAAMNPQTP